MSSPRTVEGIQYLRGIAALLVVVTHSNSVMRYPEYFGSSPLPLVNTGTFGVAIFFVISGFIMAIIALDMNGAAKTALPLFVERRFRRIVPFLWLCIIGYNLFTYAGTGTVEWGPAIRALLLWPIGDLKPNVVWTLRHEIIFYAIFALTLLSARRRPALLAIWLVAPLFVSSACSIFPMFFADIHPYAQDLINVFLVGRGANLQFGCGMMLGLLWMRQSMLMRLALPGGPLMLLVIAAGAAGIYEIATPMFGFAPIFVVPLAITGPVEIIISTGLATIVVWCGAIAIADLGQAGRIGRVLGDASYSIYLVHNAAVLATLEGLRRLDVDVPSIAVCVSITVAATLFGVVVHYLVEVPLLRWLGRTAKGRTAGAPVA